MFTFCRLATWLSIFHTPSRDDWDGICLEGSVFSATPRAYVCLVIYVNTCAKMFVYIYIVIPQTVCCYNHMFPFWSRVMDPANSMTSWVSCGHHLVLQLTSCLLPAVGQNSFGLEFNNGTIADMSQFRTEITGEVKWKLAIHCTYHPSYGLSIENGDFP